MPFCPRCGDEFQDWVKVCPDCSLKLVNKLAPKPTKIYRPEEELVTIASYIHPVEAHIAVAKLKSGQIQAVVVDEHSAIANSLFGIGLRLQVKKADAIRAIKILKTETKTEPVRKAKKGRAAGAEHNPHLD